MSDRVLRGILVAVFVGSTFMGVFGFVLKQEVTPDDVLSLPFLAFAVVGLAVGLREPRNAVGRVFLLVGTTPTIGFFTSAYAFRGLETGLPATVTMEWVSSWAWFPGIGAFVTFGLLLFPDGRLPSRRWKAVAYFSGLLILVITLALAMKAGPMEPFDLSLPRHDNPYGWQTGSEAIGAILGVAFPLLPLAGLASLLSLIFRYRQRGLEQRQQIKWFAYSAPPLVLVIVLADVFDRVLGESAGIVYLVGLMFPSVGAGIGILKYRLYDIDVVINRTLVYGLLSAILALTYLAIVVLLQGLLAGITEESDLAVAGSTLVVAGLFRPLRARVQGFIDRRFYRRKYDARVTLESFSARLREDVDLDHLASDLSAVVQETMQPAHVSVWLKPPRVPA